MPSIKETLKVHCNLQHTSAVILERDLSVSDMEASASEMVCWMEASPRWCSCMTSLMLEATEPEPTLAASSRTEDRVRTS
jgi:hypothetical protein